MRAGRGTLGGPAGRAYNEGMDDTRLEHDVPRTEGDRPEVRRFKALAESEDAPYPMLGPAAAITTGHEEEVFDEQILAGLVNI